MKNIATEFELLASRFDNADSFSAVQSGQAWGAQLLAQLPDMWPFGFLCPPPQGDAERDEIVWAGQWIMAVSAITDQLAPKLPVNVNRERVVYRGDGVSSAVISRRDWRTHASNGAILCRWLAEQLNLSRARPPQEWAIVFDMSWDTIKRRIDAGAILAERINSKSWKIAIDDLPPEYDDSILKYRKSA